MLTSETKRRLQSCRDLLIGKLPPAHATGRNRPYPHPRSTASKL